MKENENEYPTEEESDESEAEENELPQIYDKIGYKFVLNDKISFSKKIKDFFDTEDPRHVQKLIKKSKSNNLIWEDMISTVFIENWTKFVEQLKFKMKEFVEFLIDNELKNQQILSYGISKSNCIEKCLKIHESEFKKIDVPRFVGDFKSCCQKKFVDAFLHVKTEKKITDSFIKHVIDDNNGWVDTLMKSLDKTMKGILNAFLVECIKEIKKMKSKRKQ